VELPGHHKAMLADETINSILISSLFFTFSTNFDRVIVGEVSLHGGLIDYIVFAFSPVGAMA
jgi:hypothetical protein